MRRIKTIVECRQAIIKEDSESSITEYLIRSLANSFKIRSYKTGSKLLIDYDSLLAYLESREYDLPMEQIVIR